ncbi:MAG TPA: T9SS type A sorting domain-containing protein [Candidatus Kapabacteria bacterium]|nr:T9SS type A sorting domain-containing protein [Candidatus Kapabacteria bacterium]
MKNTMWALTTAIVLGFFATGSLKAQPWQWSVSVDDSNLQGMFYRRPMYTIDRSGNAWVLYDYGALGYSYSVGKFDGKNWTHFGPGDAGLMGGTPFNIILDYYGNVWISGDSGISEFTDGRWRNFVIKDQAEGTRLYGAMAADSNGNIWVATRPVPPPSGYWTWPDSLEWVYRFDGSDWTPFPIKGFNVDQPGGVTSLSVAPNGTLWAVSSINFDANRVPIGGLWRFDGVSSWNEFTLDEGSGIPISQYFWPIPTSVHADARGGAWVTFPNADRVEGGVYTPYPSAVNYFDGSKWDSTNLGFRFANVTLAPNGDRYFLSAPSSLFGQDTAGGGLIIENDAGRFDSLSKSKFPFGPGTPAFDPTTGYPWLVGADWGVDSPWVHLKLAKAMPANGVPSTNSSNGTLQCSVYPNPIISDAARITFSGAQNGMYRITLCNTLGVVLKAASVSAEANASAECDLSTSNIASGAYLITIANGAARVTVPVVKE